MRAKLEHGKLQSFKYCIRSRVSIGILPSISMTTHSSRRNVARPRRRPLTPLCRRTKRSFGCANHPSTGVSLFASTTLFYLEGEGSRLLPDRIPLPVCANQKTAAQEHSFLFTCLALFGLNYPCIFIENVDKTSICICPFELYLRQCAVPPLRSHSTQKHTH